MTATATLGTGGSVCRCCSTLALMRSSSARVLLFSMLLTCTQQTEQQPLLLTNVTTGMPEFFLTGC
jgi:hypothetical protein